MFFFVSCTDLLKYKDKMHKISPDQRRSQEVKPPPKPLKTGGSSMRTRDEIIHDYKTCQVPSFRQHKRNRHSYRVQN